MVVKVKKCKKTTTGLATVVTAVASATAGTAPVTNGLGNKLLEDIAITFEARNVLILKDSTESKSKVLGPKTIEK